LVFQSPDQVIDPAPVARVLYSVTVLGNHSLIVHSPSNENFYLVTSVTTESVSPQSCCGLREPLLSSCSGFQYTNASAMFFALPGPVSAWPDTVVNAVAAVNDVCPAAYGSECVGLALLVSNLTENATGVDLCPLANLTAAACLNQPLSVLSVVPPTVLSLLNDCTGTSSFLGPDCSQPLPGVQVMTTATGAPLAVTKTCLASDPNYPNCAPVYTSSSGQAYYPYFPLMSPNGAGTFMAGTDCQQE